jgi:exodeoxyribonuclease-3
MPSGITPSSDTARLKLVSWNVNGIRAATKKGFNEFFDQVGADLFALQETKLQEGQITLDLPGYQEYWSYAERKGYSGTAVFSRIEPLQVLHGLGDDALDSEGRICALEFPGFWFVNVYTPNAQDKLARIDHRLAWDDAFCAFATGLSAEKGVVICGDLNVAHAEIDLKNPGPNRGNAGFSDEERDNFTKLLDAGFIDTFRSVNPLLTGAYSWWSYRFHARENNAGWRIDYFLVSESLKEAAADPSIYDDVYGSDHCPVGLTLMLPPPPG